MKSVVQHEQPQEYSYHHGQIAVQQEPAPINEAQYAQSAEDHQQGHGRGESSQSIVHYAQSSGESPKSEEEYVPIYQYVQAQHEEQSNHAPPHHKIQAGPIPQQHGHEVQYSHQPVAFHHGAQLHHAAQEAQLHHGAQLQQGAQEAQVHHGVQDIQVQHAPSHNQVESNSHKSYHHEEPVDYYVSQSEHI